ncbi:MAG TPA: AraC family transcriptional regulator [Myxococcota bacterium]|nr:AraC family transcriptional regulator [Myxococcota bacterium]
MDEQKLRRVRDHVAANLASDLPVRELARLAGMSVSGFAHWFRRSAGCSPHAYVLQSRIALAKGLLSGSDRSLAAIALAVGFSSQACLSVSFRRCEGVTPGEFRAHGSRKAKDNTPSARHVRATSRAPERANRRSPP